MLHVIVILLQLWNPCKVHGYVSDLNRHDFELISVMIEDDSDDDDEDNDYKKKNHKNNEIKKNGSHGN